MKLRNTKKGRVQKRIYLDLTKNIDQVKIYKKRYPSNYVDRLVDNGELLFYTNDIKNLYKEYTMTTKRTLWSRYLKDVKEVVNLMIAEGELC